MTFSSQIGERLRQARKVLGLNQAQAAELTGVTREHWGRCERDIAIPGGEILAALASAGADVGYVLTGKRGGVVLSDDELAMLTHYRAAPEEVRRAALGALQATAKGTVIYARDVTMHNAAPGAIQIGIAGSVTRHRRSK